MLAETAQAVAEATAKATQSGAGVGAAAVTLVLLGAVGAFGNKLWEFTKLITNGLWKGVIAQAVAWVGFVALFVVVAQIGDLAKLIQVPGTTVSLATLDIASLVILGLGVGSGFGKLDDWMKARDNTQTAAKPALFPSDTPAAAIPPPPAAGEPGAATEAPPAPEAPAAPPAPVVPEPVVFEPEDSPAYVPGSDGTAVEPEVDGGDTAAETAEQAMAREKDGDGVASLDMSQPIPWDLLD